MPDNPQRPEEPARGELPPEPPPPPPTEPPPTETLPPAAEPAPEPGRPSRGQRFVSHRATPIVAAGLAGLLIGGGTMAIIAYAGDDDDRDGRRHAVVMDDGDGLRWERGPMPFKMLPPGQRAEKLEDFRDRMEERLDRFPMREHHHDEDGNMVPGPAPKAKDGGN